MGDFSAAASLVAAAEGGRAVDIDGGFDSVSIPENCVTAVYSVQKLADLLKRGDDSQILFALGEMGQLLENCLEDTLLLFLPAVCEFSSRWSQDLQLRAGREMLGVPKHVMSSSIGRCITLSSLLVFKETNNITSSMAAQVYEVYGRLASTGIQVTAWNEKDLAIVLRFVDQYAASPFSEERRLAVSFCLGLCKCGASELDVQRQGFSRLWSLAKDPSMDVLAKCLEVMGDCASSFTDLVVSERVWPLVQKAWAQDPKLVTSSKSLLARAAAVKCAAQLCEARSGENMRGRSKAGVSKTSAVHDLLARLLAFAEVWSKKDQRELDQEMYITEIAVAEHLVKLIYFASKGARESRSSFFMKTAVSVYAQLVQGNGPGIREKCAFNMPAMAQMMAQDKAGVAMLTNCCNELAFDSEETVRETLAKGFHETLHCLVIKGSVEKLNGTLLDLLQDECQGVKNSALEHISDSLIALANVQSGKGITGSEIKDALEKAALILTKRSWRISKVFAQQVGKICAAFPTLGLEQLVVPMLFEIVSATGSCEVRSEAATSIVDISRTIPSEEVRDRYLEELLEALTHGSHQKRICAVDCALHALKVYSEVIFSQLFATSILQLASDMVPNVRIRVAKALPQLAPWCQAHELFEPALAKLRNDPDKDVRDVMDNFVLRASQYVSKSKDEEEAVYSRRVEEVHYYSAGARKLMSGGGRVPRQQTPRTLRGIVKDALQQSRIGRRLAEIASLRSRDPDHDELARAYSMTETHGREEIVSISGPLPTSHGFSSMSWASEDRSGDAYFLRNEDGRSCPATARPVPVHARPAAAGGDEIQPAQKSVLDFSTVLSGSISSLGEPVTAEMSRDEPTGARDGASGSALHRGLSRGGSSGQRAAGSNAGATEHKPLLNMRSQALPVQAMMRRLSGRRSRPIGNDSEQPLTHTFSKDSAFSGASTGDVEDCSSSGPTAEQASAEYPPSPPRSMFRRLSSWLGFFQAPSARSPTEEASTAQTSVAASRADKAELENANDTFKTPADPPQLPRAPAPLKFAAAAEVSRAARVEKQARAAVEAAEHVPPSVAALLEWWENIGSRVAAT